MSEQDPRQALCWILMRHGQNPRQVLCWIVKHHGRSVCDDPPRVEALLLALCGENKQEINILLAALREQVVADLLDAPTTSTPHEVLLSRLSGRMEHSLAMRPDAARRAVDTWALALGVISAEELAAMEGVAVTGNAVGLASHTRELAVTANKTPTTRSRPGVETRTLISAGAPRCRGSAPGAVGSGQPAGASKPKWWHAVVTGAAIGILSNLAHGSFSCGCGKEAVSPVGPAANAQPRVVPPMATPTPSTIIPAPAGGTAPDDSWFRSSEQDVNRQSDRRLKRYAVALEQHGVLEYVLSTQNREDGPVLKLNTRFDGLNQQARQAVSQEMIALWRTVAKGDGKLGRVTLISDAPH